MLTAKAMIGFGTLTMALAAVCASSLGITLTQGEQTLAFALGAAGTLLLPER